MQTHPSTERRIDKLRTRDTAGSGTFGTAIDVGAGVATDDATMAEDSE